MFPVPSAISAQGLLPSTVLALGVRSLAPAEPPLPIPWQSTRDAERQIRLSASECRRIRRDLAQRELLPNDLGSRTPHPADRDVLSLLGTNWKQPSHDLRFVGYCGPTGEREGQWHICLLDGRVVAVLRYWTGRLIGNLDHLDAGGFTVARRMYCDGACLSDYALTHPVLEQRAPPPGPFPLGTPQRSTDANGWQWTGLLRDGRRVGPWVAYRSAGCVAAVEHYHLDSGAAIGLWEDHDADGQLSGVRQMEE
jgi:hypothetical protein